LYPAFGNLDREPCTSTSSLRPRSRSKDQKDNKDGKDKESRTESVLVSLFVLAVLEVLVFAERTEPMLAPMG